MSEKESEDGGLGRGFPRQKAQVLPEKKADCNKSAAPASRPCWSEGNKTWVGVGDKHSVLAPSGDKPRPFIQAPPHV